jgi:predicted TIM-barrel fold metal-dependent hydrolase
MQESNALLGRINDADSHEMVPVPLWAECFGSVGELVAAMLPQDTEIVQVSDYLLADVTVDEIPINADSVWRRAGWENQQPRAPGAFDMTRRLEVMDFMGVRRQQVFPMFAAMGLTVATGSSQFLADVFQVDPSLLPGLDERQQLGYAMCRAYNDWAVKQGHLDPDRLRMLALLPMHDIDQLIAETEQLLAGGIRAFYIAASVPPGGKSPADRALDPFWSLCEEADASVQLHIAVENLLATDTWRRIPEFEEEVVRSAEFVLDPWSFATLHFLAENYLSTMILGGVFERHPRLRFGVIECGANWVGPLGEGLDMWAGRFTRRMSKILSMPPSDYLARNVRVTPYWFEDIVGYVDRYGLDQVYCYGSDYPHVEGGKDQLEVFSKAVAPLGDSFVEKFFVTNAEWIMPAIA